MNFLLDDFSQLEHSRFGTAWQVLPDPRTEAVLSAFDKPLAQLRLERTEAENYLCFSGQQTAASQLVLPLVHSRYLFDARHFKGLYLKARSQESEQSFALILRTKELSMPWQHYRCEFSLSQQWQNLELPFEQFVAISTAHELNTERISKIALAATSHSFELQLAEIGFY